MTLAARSRAGSADYRRAVATFLTLSSPEPRNSAPLLARLLDNRGGLQLSGSMQGDAVRLGSRLRSGDTGVVELDVDPGSLPEHTARRYDIHPAADELAEVLALALPAPCAVFLSSGRSWVRRVEEVVAAGHSAGLPEDVAASEAADFLAVLAHAEVGFVARAADSAGVMRILSATVAALRGDDVRTAWQRPDIAAVQAVPEPAARALREVLFRIEVADAGQTQAELEAWGMV